MGFVINKMIIRIITDIDRGYKNIRKDKTGSLMLA